MRASLKKWRSLVFIVLLVLLVVMIVLRSVPVFVV